MCNDEDPILNISQAERGRKERLLTEIAQNYLGERDFKAIPQFTIHRTFEYRIHPGNELREAIEKDVFFNENLVSGGVWNTEISYRNGYLLLESPKYDEKITRLMNEKADRQLSRIKEEAK